LRRNYEDAVSSTEIATVGKQRTLAFPRNDNRLVIGVPSHDNL